MSTLFEGSLWARPDLRKKQRIGRDATGSGCSAFRAEFARTIRVPHHGDEIPCMHPEDYVLRKLVTFRRIRGKSSDADDAYQVLLHAWDLIDRTALAERARFHRVEKDAREIIRIGEEDWRLAGSAAT